MGGPDRDWARQAATVSGGAEAEDYAQHCTRPAAGAQPVAPPSGQIAAPLGRLNPLGQPRAGTAVIGPIAAGRPAQSLSVCTPRPRLPSSAWWFVDHQPWYQPVIERWATGRYVPAHCAPSWVADLAQEADLAAQVATCRGATGLT